MRSALHASPSLRIHARRARSGSGVRPAGAPCRRCADGADGRLVVRQRQAPRCGGAGGRRRGDAADPQQEGRGDDRRRGREEEPAARREGRVAVEPADGQGPRRRARARGRDALHQRGAQRRHGAVAEVARPRHARVRDQDDRGRQGARRRREGEERRRLRGDDEGVHSNTPAARAIRSCSRAAARLPQALRKVPASE